MNVSPKIYLPAIAIGATILGSCEHNSCGNVLSVAKQYCTENNKTEDYNNIINTRGRDKKMLKLDSLAYSNIFKTTKLAQDSTKVNEFNKIAAKNRSKYTYNTREPFYNYAVNSSLNKKAIEYGMSLIDYEKMQKKEDIAYRQNFLDNFVYQKFFKDNNVFDKNVKAKCNAYSKKINSCFE